MLMHDLILTYNIIHLKTRPYTPLIFKKLDIVFFSDILERDLMSLKIGHCEMTARFKSS